MIRIIVACLCLGASSASLADLKPEPIRQVQTLPEQYPAHWIIAQDAAFFHMSDGKFIVLDADRDSISEQYKGMFNGAQIAQFAQAHSRPEMYVVQTFHSLGHRGVRNDVLSVYDKRTLAPLADIVVPPKRASILPTQYALQLVDDEKLALIFNFTPATTVSVVDLDKREFLNEVPIPGCALIYPTGKRGFSSLCSEGTFLTVALDDAGGVASSTRSKQFFNADVDAVFEKPAIQGRNANFLTFKGRVIPVDLSGDLPVIGESWSLPEIEAGNWRPGGLTPAVMSANGKMYVLMHAEGKTDTHKDPGTEVWVFDPRTHKRERQIELALPAVSIELTRDTNPLLVVTTIEMNIDVYDANKGTKLRTISDFGQETPLLLHGAH
ncbi:MAG TPA: amine dehydrogenase large subunit [Woeseiaceae bacterium]|nr:amine dehydrogenase large subunit [Woeseiaceae bacterium]